MTQNRCCQWLQIHTCNVPSIWGKSQHPTQDQFLAGSANWFLADVITGDLEGFPFYRRTDDRVQPVIARFKYGGGIIHKIVDFINFVSLFGNRHQLLVLTVYYFDISTNANLLR